MARPTADVRLRGAVTRRADLLFRLGFSRVAVAAAIILFALCPLGIFFHRALLLDNPSLAFAIAALALAWMPQRRLWAFAGSGACFAGRTAEATALREQAG